MIDEEVNSQSVKESVSPITADKANETGLLI